MRGATLSIRTTLALLTAATLAVALVACDSGSATEHEDGGGVVIEPTDAVSPASTDPTAPVVVTPTAPPDGGTPAPATPGAPLESPVRGLIMPLEGACLPNTDDLMPNASREYRQGVHEGVDFYTFASCTEIVRGTAVMAVKTGRVIRADHGYVDLTPETLAEVEARVAAGESSNPEVIDVFRGRQVWIDHGRGVVTRYAHLSAIDENIRVGMLVTAGTLIAYVGDSGTPESVRAPGQENHLHFEVRVGQGFLGQGLSTADARVLYEQAFSPAEGGG